MIEIENNIIYNLSMCSLENFHTNFLKWLGNEYPEETLKLFMDGNYENINFKNQRKNPSGTICDLVVSMKQNKQEQLLVIENKIKSFPYNRQLKEYFNCFNKNTTKFILLSLAPKIKLEDGWEYLSYKDLGIQLKKIFNDKVYKNDYHKNLILDYIGVIEYLSNSFPVDNNENYDYYQTIIKDDLKDIYIKYKTSQLTNTIDELLNKNDYYIGHSFHNKKGTIDIFKEFIPYNFTMGIQIEDLQYRYVLIAKYKDRSSKAKKIRECICQALLDKNLWFNETQAPKRKCKHYDNFCGYEPDFVYRYQKLNTKMSFQDIALKVKKDIEHLESNWIQIAQIVSKEGNEE